MIEQASDMTVCASVGTPDEAISALARTRPDVVILDLALSGATGLDLISSILSRCPSAKTIQTYRNNIKEKLGITNAAELIHQATLSAQSQDSQSGRRASKR